NSCGPAVYVTGFGLVLSFVFACGRLNTPARAATPVPTPNTTSAATAYTHRLRRGACAGRGGGGGREIGPVAAGIRPLIAGSQAELNVPSRHGSASISAMSAA